MATEKKKTKKKPAKAPAPSLPSMHTAKEWIKILDARVTALEKKLKSK